MTDNLISKLITNSIFTEDKYIIEGEKSEFTVIIPALHSTVFWKNSLVSYFKEIPIKELLIGDAGCEDGTIEIAKEFPRVKILDHTKFKTLGFSIRELIKEVKTEYFIYLQTDVFLPDGWFEEMKKHIKSFEWFGSGEKDVYIIEKDGDFRGRPWAGSQIGKTKFFYPGINQIEDDYVYRQEDYILAKIASQNGGRVGQVPETFHIHQIMQKRSRFPRKILKFSLEWDITRDEDIRQWESQGKGIVKYLDPNDFQLANELCFAYIKLRYLKAHNHRITLKWIYKTNKKWLLKFAYIFPYTFLGFYYRLSKNTMNRFALNFLKKCLNGKSNKI